MLCWVPTIARQLGSKVKAVNSTWIKRCDGHLYFVEGAASVFPDVVSLDVPPGYFNLTTKVVAVMQYLYHHHLHEYDWFLKVGSVASSSCSDYGFQVMLEHTHSHPRTHARTHSLSLSLSLSLSSL